MRKRPHGGPLFLRRNPPEQAGYSMIRMIETSVENTENEV